MNAPIDEHALLVAVRQNNRIARLAEPLQAYWIGKQVDAAIESFVTGLRFLNADANMFGLWATVRHGLGE